jgi:hypothetical protein
MIVLTFITIYALPSAGIAIGLVAPLLACAAIWKRTLCIPPQEQRTAQAACEGDCEGAGGEGNGREGGGGRGRDCEGAGQQHVFQL